MDLVPVDRLPSPLGPDCLLAPLVGEPVRAKLPPGHHGLFFDHNEIVQTAVDAIRNDYQLKPDPYRLLGDEFTLYDLRRLHEAVLGPSVPKKDTFRRLMAPQLEPTGRRRRGTVGAPALLFQRTATPAGRHAGAEALAMRGARAIGAVPADEGPHERG